MRKEDIAALVIISIVVLLIMSVCSCHTVRYVPVETVKYDSLYLSTVSTDSVYVKDSVLIIKGDTVTEYRCRYIYKYKDRIDTVYVNRTDSVQVPYPVEKRLTKWQRFRMDVGGYAVVAVIVLVFAIVGYFLYRIRKK